MHRVSMRHQKGTRKGKIAWSFAVAMLLGGIGLSAQSAKPAVPAAVPPKPVGAARKSKAPSPEPPHRSTQEEIIPELREPKPDPLVAAIVREVSTARIRQAIEKLASFGTRHTFSAADEAAIKRGRGIGAAREWIRAEFERTSRECGGCLEVATDRFTQPVSDRVPQPAEIVNVYAILRGKDPEAAKHIFLVTGHYDSRNSDGDDARGDAPGANDDASGTAVSLECARVLSKHKFAATVIFLTVAGEEEGLYGSEHFAKMAKEQGWQIDGVLNNDIVGGNRTPGDDQQDASVVRVFSEGVASDLEAKAARRMEEMGYGSDSPSRQLARYVRSVDRQYFPQAGKERFVAKPIFRHDRFLRGGDHMSFNEQGFAGVRFTEYREDFHHQHQNPRTENGIEYGDMPKFVDFEYAANVARLNAATLASLAQAPATPRNVRMLAGDLTNETTLAWDAPFDASEPRYEVLWRATTEPYWTFVEDVGLHKLTTLPRSKDNVLFAVRSTDRKGHKSLAVVPRPVRTLDEK